MALKAAVLGHGVVGSGVVEILLQQQDCIEKQAGKKIELGYILDVRSFDELPYAARFTKDIQDILNDPEVAVVAECIGGATIAFELVSACLKAGKNVCTSNKELIATRGNELFALAKEHHVNLLYEACVGGGIPVLRPLQTCFGANRITEITGILNGTTNYILTEMAKSGSSMEDALAKAQKNGYAEANPSADIDGLDAARKISILASMACGKYVDPNEISVTGIRKVTAADLLYAKKAGCAVKLIAAYAPAEDGVSATVSPALVSERQLLAHVSGVLNAVRICGDMVGETVFYGAGAGKLPTASAVVSDLITLTNLAPCEPMLYWSPERMPVTKKEQKETYYVRFSGGAREEALSRFEQVQFLGDAENKSLCAAVVENVSKTDLLAALAGSEIGLLARVYA